jgi:hypothetical protein
LLDVASTLPRPGAATRPTDPPELWGSAFEFAQAGSLNRGGTNWVTATRVPLLWPWLVCAVAPAWAVIRRLPRRRRALHVCTVCGYDLRESLERCPECGAAVPAGHRLSGYRGALDEHGSLTGLRRVRRKRNG